MDTEEDILAIYINLINISNMVDAFTNSQMDSIFLYETIARKKDMRSILLLQTNDKYKVVVKGKGLLANALPIYSFKFTRTFVLIN